MLEGCLVLSSIYNIQMGNKIIGKRSPEFYKGFDENQLQYLRDKFEILKDQNGFLSPSKIAQSYKCSDKVANKVLAFIDFDDNKQVEEYDFICGAAAFCNATPEKLGKIIFDMIVDKDPKKKEKGNIEINNLYQLTSTVIKYNNFIENGPDIGDKEIDKINKKKYTIYDVDKSGGLDEDEFTQICMVDRDYKLWLYNMGFITKAQMQNQGAYDDLDSDLDQEVDKHKADQDEEIDNKKRGIQRKNLEKTEKPWRKTIMKSGIDTKDKISTAPVQTLNLQYVLGFRSFDCRNNVKYNSSGKIVYHQAALGIVLDSGSNKQDFMSMHNDDITCLDLVEDLVVTGENGNKPIVTVWSSDKILGQDFQVLHVINEGLQGGIGNVCLSETKKLLAVSCDNEDHNIIIYDLALLKENEKATNNKQKGVVAEGKGTQSVIMDLKFSKDQKTLVAATLKDILFITYKNKSLKSVSGTLQNLPAASYLCVATFEKNVTLSGMSNGSIYMWEKNKCRRALVGHMATVTALAKRTDKKSIISGDKNGIIILWSDTYEKEETIELPKNANLCYSNRITTICMSKNKRLVVGTRGSDILQKNLNDKQFKRVMCGHSDKQLLALTTDKLSDTANFYTAGQDKRIIMWRLKDRKPDRMISTKYMIRSIDVNINMKLLAVGYRNGIIEFFDSQTLEKSAKSPITTLKNPDNQVISLIKFDPEGKYLVICYNPPNSSIMLYNTTEQKVLTKKETKVKITSLDFSNDSKRLQVNTEDFDVLFFELPSLNNLKIENTKDQKWNTNTIALSYQTQGLFYRDKDIMSDLTQFDAVCCEAINPTKDTQGVLLVGDQCGKIRLYNYPTIKNFAYNKYNGHSSAISALKITKKDKKDGDYFISTGRFDKAVMLWKYERNASQVNSFGEQEEDENVKNEEGEEADQETLALMEQKQKYQQSKQCFEEYGIVEQTGEEAMATKPFLAQIHPPSKFVVNYAKDNKLPEQDLQIEHVFGIRNQYLMDEVRNQCRYYKDFKSIVYPTAALGVHQQLNKPYSQTYFKGHHDDIVSFALNRQRDIAATGQMAEKNVLNPLNKILSIYVWSVETKEVLKKLDGFHKVAVVLLEFSPDSKLLFTVGNDQKNSYAIYNWRNGIILYNGPVSRGKVNGIAWKNNTQFATCGNDHIKFWDNNKSRQAKIPGPEGKSDAMFSIVSSKDVFISGGGKGYIYNWIAETCNAGLQAHEGKVHTLALSNGMLYSGADDGIIKAWKLENNGASKKTEEFAIDLRSLYKPEVLFREEYGVLSIDCSTNGDLLIVTKGCDIITHNPKKKNQKSIISRGHYKDELWGLSVCVDNDRFVTGGDDGTIKLWSISEKRMIGRQNLEKKKIRGIDCSSDGKMIVAADQFAKLYLYSSKLDLIENEYKTQLSGQNQSKKFTSWVQQIKFSPNSKFIAVGCHGKSQDCETLKITSGLQKGTLQLEKLVRGIFTSALLHLDWDKDSDIVSTNSQSYELQFFSAHTGKMVKASGAADIEWQTWTKKLGFPVQGIFQGIDFSEIHTVCADNKKQILAVGYNDQTIRLFKYPAYVPKQVCKQYFGHSSHITRVRFNDNYLISTGGNDRTAIIWRVIRSKYSKMKSVKSTEDDEEEINYDIDVPMKAIKRPKPNLQQQDQFEVADEEGEQFMAIKPWIGALKPPTYQLPDDKGQKPDLNITLEYVYGYRAKDCRQNLFYYNQKEVLYHAAAVVIIHKIQQNSQTLITQHDDDILSIDYHRDGLILTGQIGPKPLVILHESETSRKKWRAPVKKGVLCVSISPDATKAVCVGMDDNHQVAVINLEKQNQVLCTAKGGRELIIKVGWLSEDKFVTVGIKHFKIWTFDGSNITAKNGNLKMGFVSLAIKDKLILTGAENDTIVRWNQASSDKPRCLNDQIPLNIQIRKNKSLEKEGKATDPEKRLEVKASIIQAIYISRSFVVAGSKNKHVFVLKKDNLEVLNCLNMQVILQESRHAGIRSIQINDDQDKMLVGTLGSEIFQIVFKQNITNVSQDSKKIQIKTIMQAHYSPNNTWTNEVWGLCIDPSRNRFFTCSDDSTVRCWDMDTYRQLSVQSLNYGPKVADKSAKLQMDQKTGDYTDAAKGTAIGITTQGTDIFVGCKNGVVRMYSFDKKSNQLKYEGMFRKANQRISDIKFFGNTLVIGSHDNAIYVYDYEEGTFKPKERYKPLKKHSSYITHFDFSRDCAYLHSTCGAYELLFWDLNIGKQLTSGASSLKDERWATWTCTLGWPVQGIWPKYQDGTYINAVDRSHFTQNGKKQKDQPKSFMYLAAGNDSGKVVIYNYPCVNKNSPFVQGKGHSSHVTNVRWSNDDRYIISTGGQDQCVMQWKVTKTKSANTKKK